MTDSNSAVAEATAPVKKQRKAPNKAAKSVKKKVAKKKGAKKAAKKQREGGRMDDSHDTIRLRIFKLLKKNPNGQTGSQIAEKLELSGIPNLLRDEGIVASPPRIKREEIEGQRGVVYSLTAAGKKALENGTVNSGAPGAATGKSW